MAKRLPYYILAGVIMYSAYQIKGYEGLLAASCMLFFFAGLID